MVWTNGGSTRVRGAKKIFFSNVVNRPLGMPKQVFLARFEPVVTRFGPRKIPKCLENGPFWDQAWVKNGSKMHFSKSVPGPLGMLEQVSLVHFEPVVARYGPWKIPKCLENGPFWDQKRVQNGSKCIFPKVILDHLGCSNKCFYLILSLWGRVLGHGASQNAFKMSRLGIKNTSKMGQNCVFPKVIVDH